MASLEKAFKYPGAKPDPKHTQDWVCWECEESYPAHLPGVTKFRHDHADCTDKAWLQTYSLYCD